MYWNSLKIGKPMNEMFEKDLSNLWKYSVGINILCVIMNFGTFCTKDECSNWELFTIEILAISAIYIAYIDYNLLDRYNHNY